MITAGLTNNARFDFLDAFRGDMFKIALYSTFADIGPQTIAYTPENEVPESGDYVSGGMVLQGYMVVQDGRSALLDWIDPVWEQCSVAAQGALIYNASKNNRAVAVLDFGEIVVSTNSSFRVKLPKPSTIRIP